MKKIAILLNNFILTLLKNLDMRVRILVHWLNNFKKTQLKTAFQKNSKEVINNARFLPKVIEYDRYQPEFYEDTFTYIKKRTNREKVKKGLNLYIKRKKN